jgi:hypothetical protein
MIKLSSIFRNYNTYNDVFSAGYWEQKYIAGKTRWDNGKPSSAVVKLLELNLLKPAKIAVLGSGNGHDALFFSQCDRVDTVLSVKGKQAKN